MLDVVSTLSDAFKRDVELIAELVLNEYRRVSEDIAWQETYPFQKIKTYRGLQRHLRSRCLSLSQDEIDDRVKYPGVVYISPKWILNTEYITEGTRVGGLKLIANYNAIGAEQ